MFLARFLLTDCVRSSRGISNYFLRLFLEVNIMTIGTFFAAGFFGGLGGLTALGAVQLAGILLGALGDVIGKHVS